MDEVHDGGGETFGYHSPPWRKGHDAGEDLRIFFWNTEREGGTGAGGRRDAGEGKRSNYRRVRARVWARGGGDTSSADGQQLMKLVRFDSVEGG